MGLLSNISEEKGIIEFLDLLETMLKNNPNINLLIGGPFTNKTVKQKVLSRIKELEGIEWIDPVYCAGKKKFFRKNNFFVFSEKYSNEAEPLIIYEAFPHGIPVVAYGRGCIPEQIGSNALLGKVVLPWIQHFY